MQPTPDQLAGMRLDAPPQPWRHNPSSWRQRLAISAIAFVALVISIYLGLYQWRLIDSVWDPFFGEGSMLVLDSKVSHEMRHWIGIPDAILGSFAYIGDIVFALAGSTRRWQYRPWLVILFGIDVIPLGIVSAILVGLQGLVVQAWCTLCLASAVISLSLIPLAYDEVWSSILYLRMVKRRSGSWVVLWRTFWGVPSRYAYLAGREMADQK